MMDTSTKEILKESILEVLIELENFQINVKSESARELICNEILNRYQKNIESKLI